MEAGVVSVGPADEPQLCLVRGVQELADALSGVVAHQVAPRVAVAADGVHELAQLRLSEHDRRNSTNSVGFTVFAAAALHAAPGLRPSTPATARAARTSSWGACPATAMTVPSSAPRKADPTARAGGPGGIDPSRRPAFTARATRFTPAS